MTENPHWEAGLPHEVLYWKKFLSGRKGPDGMAELQARLDPQRPFHPDVEAAVRFPSGSHIRVLDVGAGPITSLGYLSKRFQIALAPIDVLADEYDRLLLERGMRPPVRTHRIKAEDIGSIFWATRFEVIHARNSLDHCADPMRVLAAMHELLVPGGLLYIRTYGDEGERREYAGLHGWNFEVRDERLFLWRPGERHDLSSMFPGGTLRPDPAPEPEIIFTYIKDGPVIQCSM